MKNLTELFFTPDINSAYVQMMVDENDMGHHARHHDQTNPEPLYEEETVTVLDKFNVSAAILSLVQYAVEAVFPLLRQGTGYSAQDIIGGELWSDMTSPLQREATVCLEHLASQPDGKLRYSPLHDGLEGGFMIKHNH